MSQFKPVTAATALELIEQGAIVADIRDPGSFEHAHIKGAISLSNDSLQSFIDNTDFEQPIIVCCYHGISSQSAAAFLSERGFEQVYSLDGGFDRWALAYPDHCDRA